MNVQFTIPGEPKGKGRPRFKKTGKTYTPTPTAEYEEMVRWEYASQCENYRFPDDCGVSMYIDAHFAIPKSASEEKKQLMFEGDIKPTKKPDVDNILKIIADSLNGVAYKDDAQIVEAHISKWYSDCPGVTVTLLTE